MKGTHQSWENTQHCAVGIYQEISGNVNRVGDQLEIVVSSVLCFIPSVIKEFLGENRWCFPLCHPLLWPNSLHSVPSEKQFLHPPCQRYSWGTPQPKPVLAVTPTARGHSTDARCWLPVRGVPSPGGTKMGPPRWLCAALRSAAPWLGSGQVTALCQRWFLSHVSSCSGAIREL